MKKLSFITALLLCVSVVFAQKGKVTSASSFFTQGKLDKAKELIDEAVKHDNVQDWPKAFFVQGQIYQAIFESQEANYNKLSNNALQVAWDAYEKVQKLDDGKGKFDKDLKAQFLNLEIDFLNQGINYYNDKDYVNALKDFLRVQDIKHSKFGSQNVDTALIYNIAVTAQNAGDMDVAKEYYKKTLDLGYETNKVYAMMANIYLNESRTANEKGDSTLGKAKQEEAVKYLLDGYELYPGDPYMLIELINYYLMGEDPIKAEPYLDEAIRQNPTNGDFYRTKGNLYEKLHQADKTQKHYVEQAEQLYKKTLELNPDDFVAQYNLGNIELNKVIEDHQDVNAIDDIKEYNAALEVIMNRYESIIPYFERALELKPGDRNTITTLKELYFRLRSKNDDFMKKYEYYNGLL